VLVASHGEVGFSKAGAGDQVMSTGGAGCGGDGGRWGLGRGGGSGCGRCWGICE